MNNIAYQSPDWARVTIRMNLQLMKRSTRIIIRQIIRFLVHWRIIHPLFNLLFCFCGACEPECYLTKDLSCLSWYDETNRKW